MMRSMVRSALLTLGVSTPVMAQTTFFGENQAPAGGVSGAPVTARNNFLAQLSGVSTEDFTGFAGGSTPASLSFAGSAGAINATFSGGAGEICPGGAADLCGAGRYATSATNYFATRGQFDLTFTSPIAAFGFYATDIGDFSGQLSVELLRSVGGNTTIAIPHTIGGTDGSLLFWGVIDTANPFTGVRFLNSVGQGDAFGFDDLTVGDVRQVTGGVPEPATWAMMLFGFGGLGYAMRRRSAPGVRVRFA
jgi:hypothetical protein